MTSRRLLIGLHDLLATVAALFASFFLRWGSTEFVARIEPIAVACLVTLPVAIAAYWFFRLPHAPWKFASLPDLGRIAAAVTVPTVTLALVDFVARGQLVVPRTVPVIYWLVQLALLAGPRIAYRIHRSRRHDRRAFKGVYRSPVLIAGTDDEADGLLRRLRRDAVSSLEPVGLLTGKARHLGERIQGVPVLGRLSELDAVLATLDRRGVRPKRLIVMRATLESGEAVDQLLGSAKRLGIAAVRVSQALTDIGGGEGALTLAPVSIDDLLGRSAREVDLAPVRALIAGRNVVVTGAGGSIGSELCRQIAAMAPRRLMLFELSELALWSVAKEVEAAQPGCEIVRHLGNVRDGDDVRRAFLGFGPDLVFHAAALKHVDIVEAHPVAAAGTNTLGTLQVAQAARESGAACAVFISTDKAVDPVSVLGATKRAGELVFAAEDQGRGPGGTRFLAVRFGNVLGSSGSVIPLFAEQLRRGGPVTVTHPEVERWFMTVGEAVRLVLSASAEGMRSADDSPVFVLDMGQPVRILDLARRMIRLAGLEPGLDVEIAFTGLRPGERLSEVLESHGEILRDTGIPGIRRLEAGGVDRGALDRQMTRLRAAVAAHDAGAVRAVLRDMVSEYRPDLAADPSAPPPRLAEAR